jgi:membrane protease YdiL (CAAX protease family)
MQNLKARRYLLVSLKVFAFFALWVAAVALFSVAETPPFWARDAARTRLWLEFFPLLFTRVLTLLFWGVAEKGRLKINVFAHPVRDFALGLFLGCIWIGVVLLVTFRLGAARLEKTVVVNNVIVWFCAVFLNAVMQEYLVCGYIFALLKKECGGVVAVIATTALFTVLHAGAFGAGVVAVANVVSMRVFVSLLYLFTRNLCASILVHFVWNAVGGVVFGLLSLAEDYPHIFAVSVAGNQCATGGAAQIEGSLITLFINCLLILFLVYLRHKKEIERNKGACAVFPHSI